MMFRDNYNFEDDCTFVETLGSWDSLDQYKESKCPI